jgi:polysaccharide export outer membrane protein
MTFLRAIWTAALAMTLVLAPGLAPSALAQDNYRLKPGDVVRVEVLEDGNLNRDALILPDGRISLPLAGAVPAAGRSLDDVQADLVNRLAPNFAAPPTVFVSLSQLATPPEPQAERTVSVFLMGESANPGKLEVSPGSTVLQALAQSGGFSPFAAKKRVQLRRGGAVYTFDYTQVEKSGNVAGFDTVLTEGDVIVIPTRRLFE